MAEDFREALRAQDRARARAISSLRVRWIPVADSSSFRGSFRGSFHAARTAAGVLIGTEPRYVLPEPLWGDPAAVSGEKLGTDRPDG